MGRRGYRSGGFNRSFGRTFSKSAGGVSEDGKPQFDMPSRFRNTLSSDVEQPGFAIPKSQPPSPAQRQSQRQSVQPKSVQPTLKSAQQQPRAQLPNLDDINDGIQATQSQKRYRQGQVPSDDRRQYVNYQDQYATTGVKNKLKDRYKRGKKSKKGSSIFGTLEGSQSGNSVLDSYRSLGKKFR